MTEETVAEYPTVRSGKRAVQVTATIGEIAPGALVSVFSEPLRVCAESTLGGRRIGLDYTLFARNLREPVRGRLRIHLGSATTKTDRSLTG
jgi:hypothetical protein